MINTDFRIFTMIKLRVLSLILLFVAVGLTLSAQSASWTGSTSTDWNTASNWNPAQVPTASSDIVISSSPNNPVLSGAGFARSFVDKRTKMHIEQEDVDVFRGNMIFASLD